MKILVIPDLHGKTIWKEAVVNLYFDICIFLGDYVDASLDVSDKQICDNLLQIIQYKKENPDNVFLLLGNHDIHYMYYPNYPCSGFREALQPVLTSIFINDQSSFQIAFQQNNYLFTHAGVSKNWYGKHKENFNFKGNLAVNLNNINNSDKRNILHEVGEIRGGWGLNKQHGGPTWADKSETLQSMLKGFHQIVGHSKVSNLTKIYEGDNEESDTSITYCDCLGSKTEFLLLEL